MNTRSLKFSWLWAVVFLPILSGCNEISGTLDVIQPVKLKTWSGEVQVDPGTYDAKVGIEGRKKVVLYIEHTPEDDDPFCRINPEDCPPQSGQLTFKFKIPSGTELPEDGGEFLLPAKKSGQPYDLLGNMSVDRWRGDTVDGWERCTYRRERYVCRERRRPPRRRPRPSNDRDRDCRWVYETVWGDQRVSYHINYERREIEAFLRTAGDSNIKKARFTGVRTDADKVYSYIGVCR